MNIICFGDSITHGAEFNKLERWPSLLQQKLDEWSPRQYQVYNRGRGGHTTSQGFDRFSKDVLPHLPGLVLIQFGFNDANVRDWASIPRVSLEEYQRNLREFHRVVLVNKSHCVFIINHIIGTSRGFQGNGKSYKENFSPYNHAVREMAIQLGAPSIDLPEIMKRWDISLDDFLAEDGLHLSRTGNYLYADMIFSSLLSILENTKSKKF